MAATVSNSTSNPYDFLNGASSSTSSKSSGATPTSSEQNQRFLKLLTTQLTNQDPLNPMDNAQMTSQIAQISTVTGIEQLNASIGSLGTQFVQMQALQGAAMVGREVVVPGDAIGIADGKAGAGYELSSAADKVTVDVLNPAGQVIKTLDLGAQASGRHDFSFSASGLEATGQYSFRVNASLSGSTISSTALTSTKVNSVSTSGGALQLELANGQTVAYDSVRALR